MTELHLHPVYPENCGITENAILCTNDKDVSCPACRANMDAKAMTGEEFYNKGIGTGWALVVEMIERGDCDSLSSLADQLRLRCSGKMDARQQLAMDHMTAMYATLMLPKNAAKGGWDDLHPEVLFKMIEIELNELKGALWGFMDYDKPLNRVVSEAADLSNYAAMLVDKCRQIERGTE